MEKIKMKLQERKNRIAEFTKEIRESKKEISSDMKNDNYTGDKQNELRDLKDSARHFIIAHSLRKRGITSEEIEKDSDTRIMDSITSYGIETKWKEENQPNIPLIRSFIKGFDHE